jgi:DNA-binding SARP family transcriptional activator/tetratricopeptide (TPR) repeat protein
LEFRILGPLEVLDGDRLVEVRAPQQRALLVALLLHAGQVVSANRLIDLLWGPAPPDRAMATVQTYVYRLRQMLRRPDGSGDPVAALHSRGSGYVLEVAPGGLDLARFRRLADEGRQAVAAGELERGAAALRRALGLWRGPALAGVAAEPLRAQARRLEEERLRVLEESVEAELELGWHADLVGELTGLVGEQPLREWPWRQLMLALYRSGRQADALAAYRDLRRVMVEELGIEPGAELQRLQQQILAADPALEARSAAGGARTGPADAGGDPPVPRQLPADVATFTGRERELAWLERALALAGSVRPLVITAIDGTGGIGKSALAIHAAHRLAERFPDGQLYVNLQGATAGLEPLAPLEALGRFLRALGVGSQEVPSQVEEAAARFRSEVAGRRVLVVLDNARTAEQVRPLLPGDSSCGVLITSRQVLASLEGAQALHLDVLPRQQALELLGRLAGPARVAADPAAAAQVVAWCGHLPLAILIAGARLAARPRWPLRALAERMADATRRLEELRVGELAVRASFDVSLDALQTSGDPVERAAAAAFGPLSLPDGPDLGVATAARLLDRPEGETEELLERLVDARLLETPRLGRYRFHDLVRLYARQHADRQDDQVSRHSALERAFSFYVATAWRAHALLRPGDQRLERIDPRWTARGNGLELADPAAALAWLESERANLVAAVRQAAAIEGLAGVAPQIAHALFGFFQVRSYWPDWIQVNHATLEVARRTGDRAAQAQAHHDLGVIHMWQARYEEAVAQLERSLALRRELDDRRGQPESLTNLGTIHERQGRYQEALACLQQSLAISGELDDRPGQAKGLSNLASIHERQGRYHEALACLQQSLAICQELGHRYGQALNLANLGIIYEQLERYDEALDCLQRSLASFRELGDPYGQSENLNNLGSVYQRQGRYDEALACLEQSLAIRRELGDRHGQAAALRNLGDTLRTLGRHQQARMAWQEALGIYEALRLPEVDQIRARLSAAPAMASRPGRG